MTPPESSFQPREVEMDKACDMPGESIKQIRQAFIRPVNVRRTVSS